MPEVENTYGTTPDAIPENDPVPDPTWGQMLGAEANQNLDIVNAYQFLAKRHTWPVDPTFNLRKTLEEDQLFDTHNGDFVGVKSLQEYGVRKAAILQDAQDRDVLARSGKTGIAIGLGMQLLSPTMLLPFVGEARGLKGIAQTAKNALIAAAVSEMPILANHPGKPLSEVSLDLGAQTVLGAILGGAHVALRPGEREALVAGFDRGDHMAIRPGGTAIPALTPESGTFDLLHGRADTGDFTGFQAGFKGDRYEGTGGSFGSGGVYLDNNGQWQQPGQYGFGVKRSFRVQLQSDKMLMVTPDTLALLRRELGRDELHPHDILEYAKANGYDAINVHGFTKLFDDIRNDPRSVAASPDGLVQDTRFIPWDKLTGEEKTFIENKHKGRDNHAEIMAELKRDGASTYELESKYMVEQKIADTLPQDQVFAFNPEKIKVTGDYKHGDAYTSPDFGPGYRMQESVGEPVGGSGMPQPGGAATPIAQGAGGLAPGGEALRRAMDSNQVTRNPVTFNLAGESDQVRWTTAQVADSGLSLEGNKFGIPTTPGGTVENRVPLYYAIYGKASEKLDEMYRNYFYKGQDAGAFGGIRANVAGNFSIFRAEGQLSRPQFNTEVTRAGWNNDVHVDPHVQEAAQFMRQTVFEPILKRLQEAGLLGEHVEVLADKSYVHRLFDHGAIIKDPNGFVQLLANKFEQKLNADFSKGVEKLSAKAGKDVQTVDNLRLTAEDVAQAKADYTAKLEALNEGRSPELTSIEDQLSIQRASLYELRQRYRDAPDIATKLSLEKDISFQKDGIEALEGVGGQGLTDVRKARKIIADRVANLGRAQGVLAAKQARKLELASKIEQNSIESLRTIARAGQRVLNKLDTLSDEALNKEYSALQDRFAKLAAVFDRGEEQIGKLQAKDKVAAEFIGPKLPTETMQEVNTRGKGIQYHGTSNPELALDTWHYSTKNYYGQGFYTTDAVDIAHGYAGRGADKTGGRHLYEVKENRPLKLYDAEQPIDAQIKAALTPKTMTSELDGLIADALDANPKNVRELYDHLRDEGTAEGMSADTIQEMFDGINENLRGLGYDGITHLGGLRTGKEGHKVAIYFDPEKDLTINRRGYDEFMKTDKLGNAQAQQEVRTGKLSDLTDQITEHETLDRDQIRAHIGDQLEAVIERTQDLNARRAIREAKLREEAKALDPQKALDRIAEIHARRAERESNFLADIRERGGDDVALDKSTPAYKGTANFGEFALRGAREVKDKILGTTLRSPTIDMMQGERAAVLARVLDISSHDLEPWLDTDIERITRSYLRTSGPDIELAKKFGDVQAEKYLGNNGSIVDEMNQKLAMIETSLDKRGRPLSEAAKAKEAQRIKGQYDLYRKNLEAIIKRLRHQDGLPSDPNALGYRLGKAALNINTLRFMGGVVLSSLPDAARVVMRYGVTRTFRDGFVPLMTNLKTFKMGAQEIKYAGAANEIVSNTRGRLLNDIFDDMHRGSKFEQGLEWAASKQGIVGAFSYWTDAMKMFTGVVANGKILDSIADTMTGKGTSKTAEFLAQNGIGPGEAAHIWDQVVRNGGGQRVNGVWLPNTEAWDNVAAQDAFRAAVNREVNNAIVTPGVERPLWMTGSMTGRLLGQFKSFTFSSTTRMLQAGLQQRDMAVAQGMALSLAFGALSYYLYAVAAGGDTEDEMRNAGLGKWADEAIARSGIQGALGLGQDLLSRIPATQGISSFSGGRTLRHGGGSLVEALAGPTFDAVETGARVISEINDPDSGTVHAARKLLLWQNVTGVRRIFDALEAAVPVPEKN